MATTSSRSILIAHLAATLTIVTVEALATLPDAPDPDDPSLGAAVDGIARGVLADLTDAEVAALTVVGRDRLAEVARDVVVPHVLAAVQAEANAPASPWLDGAGPLRFAVA